MTFALRERPELEDEVERPGEAVGGMDGYALPRHRVVVPGALQPVVIDRERDEGRDEDPNVWMVHPL